MACCAAKFPEGTERLDDETFVYYPHRVGANVLICGKKNSKFPMQCFVGPEWPCMFVTTTLVIVPVYYFIKNVAFNWGIWVSVVVIILAACTLTFYIFTACSDPGIVFFDKIEEQGRLVASSHSGSDDKEGVSDVEMNTRSGDESSSSGGVGEGEGGGGGIFERDSGDEASRSLNPVVRRDKVVAQKSPGQENMIQCGHCECKRPRNAHHCHECKLCILDLDHHCPWTGKCIGKKNLTFFHNFLVSLSSLICFVIIAVIYTASSGLSIMGRGAGETKIPNKSR